MQLERLQLQNFRQYENTELILGAGLTGIIGPNGAGKTTLLEAIAWALYGADAARGTRDTIRRRGAPPRAPVRVELDFVLGAHRYRVARTLNGAELYQDADPAPIANSLQSVTERVARLLGMSREEFFNTYFTGQKQLAVMAAMKPVERAQFLSRVLGYDRLQVAQDRLRERRTMVRATLQGLEAALPDPAELDREAAAAAERVTVARDAEAHSVAALSVAEARRGESDPRWKLLQAQREQVATLQSDLRLAEHKVDAARDSFQLLDRELVAANEARSRLEGLRDQLAPLEALRAERQRLDDLAEAAGRRKVAEAQLVEARRALETLLARAAKLPPADAVEQARARVEELRTQLQQVADVVEEARTAWVRDLQDAKTKREALRDQYRELKEQLEQITTAGVAGACPTCARPLGAEYDNVIGVLDRQLQDVLFNGKYFSSRVEQLEQEPPELREGDRRKDAAERELAEAGNQLGRLQAQAQDGPAIRAEQARLELRISELAGQVESGPAGYDAERHATVRRELAALDPLALQAERWRAAAERAEKLVADAEAAEKALSLQEQQVRALREQLMALGYSEALYLAARESHELAERDRREAEMGIVRARAERQSAEQAGEGVARRREERATRAAEAKRTAGELALVNELDRALTDLRTDLNLQLRPDLSELASGFVRDLTAGRYTELELDEDYVATLLEGGEPKPVISGGEEDLANLALRLAISQMIADRAGQPLSLLVLDEVFGSLDEERRNAVVDLLRSLADRFPQVILITHIDSVREGFDRVVRVELDSKNGIASVREEAPGVSDGLAA
ncbi:MAG: SMC family ATPase [Gemmatimonadales bacterium]